MTLTQHTANEINKNKLHIPLSGVSAYHLLSGSLSLQNSVVTNGFGTTLHTGNGTTQAVVTGVDMATQWGNSVTETFGGLVWGKSRSAILNNFFFDTVRGVTKEINSNTTEAETTLANSLTAFNNNGFSLGSDVGLNTNLATYASWNFQTTHQITGTTNHGKAYTCHYNPFTGFTMVKYEGSGLAGHEIPHHLGRKLGFVTTKNLSAIANWNAIYKENSGMYLNATNAEGASANVISSLNDTTSILSSSDVNSNTSTNQYIMYGWANSYFDKANTLIGNYNTFVDGNGILRIQVHTNNSQSQVMWEMNKTTLTTGDWNIVDFTRGNTKDLLANTSAAEITITANALVNYASPASYNRATDTSNLNLNAIIPYANGIDANGTLVSTLTKNETVSGLTLALGKNYVWSDKTGAYGVQQHSPKYGSYNGFGDYFDVKSNKWYLNPSIFSDTMEATTNWIASELLGGAVSTISSVNGELKILNNGATYGAARRVETTVVGKKYRLMVSLTSASAGGNIRVGSGISGVGVGYEYFTYSSTLSAPYSAIIDFVAGTTTTYISLTNYSTAGAISTWDNYAIFPINNDGSVDISGATPITNSRNYLDAIVYADAGGQPTYVEQLPKIEYKDIIKANEYQGKNAITCMGTIDITTTPVTVIGGFNVKTAVRTATGLCDVFFETSMDNLNYEVINGGDWIAGAFSTEYNKSTRVLNKVTIAIAATAGTLINGRTSFIITGGKN